MRLVSSCGGVRLPAKPGTRSLTCATQTPGGRTQHHGAECGRQPAKLCGGLPGPSGFRKSAGFIHEVNLLLRFRPTSGYDRPLHSERELQLAAPQNRCVRCCNLCTQRVYGVRSSLPYGTRPTGRATATRRGRLTRAIARACGVDVPGGRRLAGFAPCRHTTRALRCTAWAQHSVLSPADR